MTKITDGGACPNCKLTDGAYTPMPYHIPPGSVLRDRYLVGKVLGEGGFGITYIGCDIQLEMKVAIKEYYPADRVHRDATQSLNVGTYVGELGRSYEKGKQRFLDEARVMAKLTKEPAIVRVQDFFEMNNTAYIVMEYIEGTTLSDLAKQKGGKIPPSELFQTVEPLFRDLQIMHEKNLVHRDISPDNIMIESGKVKLLDFGCAREAIDKNETLTIQLKHGYAPVEQYQQKGQGPWTDVYAFASTLYFCLTGTKPPRALDRMMSDDSLIMPTKLGIDLSAQQEKALLRALTIIPQRRTQSMAEFHAELYKKAPDPVIETGSLTVSTVVSGTDSMPDIRLRISISGKDVDPNGVYGGVAFSNGTAELTVKGGERVFIADIPAGADYRVESDKPNDFTVSSIRSEGTIEKKAQMAATFEYKAIEKPVGSLVLTNRFIGADISDAQSVRFKVTIGGEGIDPNGTYGGVEFKDGVAEIAVGNGMSYTLSGLPVGMSFKVEGDELEDFRLTAQKTEGVIEKNVTNTARFDYKKHRKKMPKVIKPRQPEEISKTVAVDTETLSEQDDVKVADEKTTDLEKKPETEPDDVKKPEDHDKKDRNKPVKKSDKGKTAADKIMTTVAVAEKDAEESEASTDEGKSEETSDPEATVKKDESSGEVSDRGLKTILITAIVAVGALLVILALVLFGIAGNRDKGGEVIFSYKTTLTYDAEGDRWTQGVLEHDTEEYRLFLDALNEYGAQVRAEFSAEPNWVMLCLESISFAKGNEKYTASSIKRDGKVVTISGAELKYIATENRLYDYNSRLYINGSFPQDKVKLKLYVVKTDKEQTFPKPKMEAEPDPEPEPEPLDVPGDLIFTYEFTDNQPDNWWEENSIHGLSIDTDEGLRFFNAIRNEDAKIVVETDIDAALSFACQYCLRSEETWNGVIVKQRSIDDCDVESEKTVYDGDRAYLVIDAKTLLDAFEDKCGTAYRVDWINGAGDGYNTYSISVYAPEDVPQGLVATGQFKAAFESDQYNSHIRSGTLVGDLIDIHKSWDQYYPDITPLIETVAPISSVTHIRLVVTAGNIEPCNVGPPVLEVFQNSVDGGTKLNKSGLTFFGRTLILELDIPKGTQRVILSPIGFNEDVSEITFDLSLEVTTDGSENNSNATTDQPPVTAAPEVTTAPPATTATPTTSAPETATPSSVLSYERPMKWGKALFDNYNLLFDFGGLYSDEEVALYNMRYEGFMPLFSPLYSNEDDVGDFYNALQTSGAKIVIYHDGKYTPKLYLVDKSYPENPAYSYEYAETKTTTNGRQITMFDCGQLIRTLKDNNLKLSDIVGVAVGEAGRHYFNVYGAQVLVPSANVTNTSNNSDEYLYFLPFYQDSVYWSWNNLTDLGICAYLGSNQLEMKEFSDGALVNLTSETTNGYTQPPVLGIRAFVVEHFFKWDQGQKQSKNTVSIKFSYGKITIKARGYRDVVIPGGSFSESLRATKEDWGIGNDNVQIDLYEPIVQQLGIDLKTFVTDYMPNLKSISFDVDLTEFNANL